MKHYFAIFNQSKDVVEVEFPDLQGCLTFGKDWDEAYENAVDVLAAWLAHADKEFIKEPSLFKDFKHLKGTVVPVPVDEQIRDSYEDMKRINVIFPAKTLRKIDRYRKKLGLKRSTFLAHAAEEYIQKRA
jgi:predicted RNase H-like HicB family nuclease